MAGRVRTDGAFSPVGWKYCSYKPSSSSSPSVVSSAMKLATVPCSTPRCRPRRDMEWDDAIQLLEATEGDKEAHSARHSQPQWAALRVLRDKSWRAFGRKLCTSIRSQWRR